MQPDHLNPARLPQGTWVGPWRVLERQGRGTYGAVYRALGVEEGVGPVALKLALHPGDERFAREGELLSRIRHPCVPRLLDQGIWQQPHGFPYPFLVMEWVDGVSLYEWARVQRPSSRRVLHVLAHLARALEATHSAASVHRDVKGDNVLVRSSDGHVFLIDFGAGHFVGAAPLTSPPFPPGTPPYRSPEAYRSVRLPMPASATAYAPQPADDVFALGITAYRLVAGEYPPSTAPTDRAPYVWKPVSTKDVPQHVTQWASGHLKTSWLAAASMGAAVALGTGWMLSVQPREEAEQQHASMPEETKDGGTVAVGDAALTAPLPLSRSPSAWPTISVELPFKPLPGQARPDAAGRCPHKGHIRINGGCWVKLDLSLKDCDANYNHYTYKGACYGPVFPPARPATSGSVEPDGDGTP
jgi:serine/threonine-protein kinase